MSFELHKAAQEGNGLIVDGLMSQNPRLVLQSDEDSRTPLHWACTFQHEQIVKRLLAVPKSQFEVDIDEMVDESGWTPFHVACSVGNLEIVKLLAQHDPAPDVNLATSSGQTGLFYAVSKGHYDVVEYLVTEFKASARIKDKRAQLPLHRAASIGAEKICELLVKKANSPLNAQDIYGFTALHHALSEGHGDLALKLVKLGADFKVADKDGQLPVDVAVDDKVRKFFVKSLQNEGLIESA
ncbi:hypothetical protein KL920_002810 [Ogataea angusta]|nr:hypothetical protein KL920_002810 [Ogataea angusta]